MPHLLLHPHSRSPRHRVAVPAAAAVLAAAAVALAGCTSAAPSTPGPRAAAGAVQITGAGSTFDAPFFTAAFAAYQQAHLGIAVSYAAVGSSAGITRYAAGQVGLRRHRRPRQPRRPGRRQRHRRCRCRSTSAPWPSPTTPSHNGNGPLRLTGPVIARIFLGQITKWDDPAIQALNPGTELPDAYITVVHRSDGSGTTYIFSNYLSARQPGLGLGCRHRPVPALAGRHRRRRQRRRGRRHRPHPLLHRLHRALLRHRHRPGLRPPSRTRPGTTSSRPPPPSPPTPPASPPSPRTTSPSSTSPAPPATPSPATAGYCSPPASRATASGKALTALISWLTHAGQSYAAAVGYVPLPPAVQQLATATLARVTGPAGPLAG